MKSMEMYWSIVSHIVNLISLLVEGWMFSYFIKPFLEKTKYAWVTGGMYSIIMVILYFVPVEIAYPRIFVAVIVYVLLCLLDRKNMEQKIVLLIIMYLLQWVAHGIAIIPRNIAFALFVNVPYMMKHTMLQFTNFIWIEAVFVLVKMLLLYLMVVGIHKVYVNKGENVSKKELGLLLSILLTFFTGYFAFTYFPDLYEKDTGQYIWYVHKEYDILKAMYQFISCSALFITILGYEKIKEKQREHTQNLIWAEQMENMKHHISEVEKLYSDIRALKHDMGNHITILENLFLEDEKEETEKYFSKLKDKWGESVTAIKTGNPVTDVIVMQKQKEMEEKGIQFICTFSYPQETKLEAFDLGIILNNALTNAIEAAGGCKEPYVSLSSYRNKNAYLIEIKNCAKKKVICNQKTGLPETTKQDKDNHGFGLVNIRKMAQKYYGDIAIEQGENCFELSVMLMVE